MTNPASLANSQVSQPDPELHETTILDDATEPGQEIRCLAPWLGVGLATDPMAWQPVTTAAGEYWPKKDDRCLVTAQPDGPPLIAWWEPAEDAEPDTVIEGGGEVPVISVFGRDGDVIAESGDYSVAQVTGAAALADLEDEAGDRIGADVELGEAIADEAADRAAAYSALDGKIAAKQDAATAATDAELAIEQAARLEGDAAEEAARIEADEALQAEMAAKQDAATAATDVELAAEKSAREAADNLRELLSNKNAAGALGTSESKYPSEKVVKAYADALLAAADAIVFKGVIDCSANPNYPSADAGHLYRVSVAGKIGGAAGVNVEVGDTLLCLADSTATGNHATVGSKWNVSQANLDGAMIGPAAAVSGNLASFNGTTGKIAQDSGLSLDTDATLAADSNARLPSQKAVKAFVQAQSPACRVTSGSTGTYKSEVLVDKPISYWRHNKATEAADEKAANKGTLHGSIPTAAGALGSSGDTDEANKFSESLSNYFSVASSASLELSTAFSVECWIYPFSAEQHGGIFCKTIAGAINTSFQLYLETGANAINARVGTATNASFGTITPNTWLHVVATYDNAKIRLYVNGELKAEKAAAGPIPTGAGESFIGCLSPSFYPFNGRLDELAVYNTTLSAARIKAHFDAGTKEGLLIPNATLTAIPFGIERFDSDTMHSTAEKTSRMTINTAGVYVPSGNVEWEGRLAGIRKLGIRLNGATLISQGEVQPKDAEPLPQALAGLPYKLAKTDYLELVAYQDSGASLGLNVVGDYTPEFAAFRAGAG